MMTDTLSSCYSLYLDSTPQSPKPPVLKGGACERWLAYGSGIADLLKEGGFWLEEAGHCEHDPEGCISFPSTSLDSLCFLDIMM